MSKSNWHFWLTFFICVSLSLTLVQSASAYTVETDHPRLVITKASLPALRAACKSAENTDYSTFKNFIDANYIDDVYPMSQGMERQIKVLPAHAFLWLVEQDTTYIHEAIENANSLFDDYPGTWVSNEFAELFYPCFWDWCSADFDTTTWTAANSTVFDDSLDAMASRYLADQNFMASAPHSQSTLIPEATYMGFALYGDGIDDATATALLDTSFAHVFGDHHWGACYDSLARDGGHFQGNNYNGTMMERMTSTLWAWANGTTDIAAFDSLSCIIGQPDWILYNHGARSDLDPAQQAFSGDKQAGQETHATGGIAAQVLRINRLAKAFEQTAAGSSLIWLDGQCDTHANPSIQAYDHYLHIPVKDTLAASAAPTAARGYPAAKRFDLGDVFMRSGWDLAATSTDIWAVYRHEQYAYARGGQGDAGSFVIARGNDLLAIESGRYPGCTGTHYYNYVAQTIGHNSILIKDFSESFGGHENSGGQQSYEIMEGSGCGVHPLTLGGYTDSLTSIYGDMGKITDYEHNAGDLTYIRSDLTKAYSAAKVDTVRREFVWLEDKDAFLVFDYADVDSTGFLQKSLIHTIAQPADTADVWTVTEDTTSMRIHFFWNASSDTIGGTGDEFEVNGTNYPPGSPVSCSGKWRIEAKTPRDAEQRWMLTVIELVEKGTAFASVESLASGDYMGAVVAGDTVLFHKYGGTYATGLSEEQNPLLGLAPSTLNFTYAEPDSHSMKFGITNSGGGILSWETTNICDWLSDSCVDTGTVGAGYDSVTVQVMWAQVAQDASLVDTVLVTGGGDGQVIINALGESTATPDTTTGVTGHRRTGSRRRGCGG